VSDIILLAHPIFGVLGIISAVWVFVEALNASPANAQRTRTMAYAVAVFTIIAWVLGGYWYVNYYAGDKALILAGPLPWAHSFMMETKEHLFFMTLVLALLLPITARANLASNRSARVMVMAVAILVALSGLAVEGAGALINFGAKVALATQLSA